MGNVVLEGSLKYSPDLDGCYYDSAHLYAHSEKRKLVDQKLTLSTPQGVFPVFFPDKEGVLNGKEYRVGDEVKITGLLINGIEELRISGTVKYFDAPYVLVEEVEVLSTQNRNSSFIQAKVFKPEEAAWNKMVDYDYLD